LTFLKRIDASIRVDVFSLKSSSRLAPLQREEVDAWAHSGHRLRSIDPQSSTPAMRTDS